MSELVLPRRNLLLGFGVLFVAPAIVRASSLMPISRLPELVPVVDLFILAPPLRGRILQGWTWDCPVVVEKNYVAVDELFPNEAQAS